MVNEGACKLKLEAFFFLGIYTLPLPKSRKVGSFSRKAVGQEEVFSKRACLGACDAACPGMERWEDSEFSAFFSLLLETSVFQPWMYPNLLGKNPSGNKEVEFFLPVYFFARLGIGTD